MSMRAGMLTAWLAVWNMPGRLALAMLRAAPAAFWAQCGAAVAMTGVFIGFGLVVWLGPWAATREEQQLNLLGIGMMIAGGCVVIALVCIMGLKLAVNASREGVRLEAERDDEPPAAVVVTNTTMVETPKA